VSIDDGDYLKVDIECELQNGTICQNRFYYLADFASGPAADADVLDDLETRMEVMYGYVDGHITNGTTFGDMVVSKIEWSVANSQWEKVSQVGIRQPTITCANANDELPNQCAAVCVAKTVRPRTMGRKFLPPYGEDQQDNGVLVAGAVTALGSFTTSYIADVPVSGSGDLRPGVVREGVNAWYTFTSGSANDTIGTQRRRAPGRGI
jgi:hypothetical protein